MSCTFFLFPGVSGPRPGNISDPAINQRGLHLRQPRSQVSHKPILLRRDLSTALFTHVFSCLFTEFWRPSPTIDLDMKVAAVHNSNSNIRVKCQANYCLKNTYSNELFLSCHEVFGVVTVRLPRQSRTTPCGCWWVGPTARPPSSPVWPTANTSTTGWRNSLYSSQRWAPVPEHAPHSSLLSAAHS